MAETQSENIKTYRRPNGFGQFFLGCMLFFIGAIFLFFAFTTKTVDYAGNIDLSSVQTRLTLIYLGAGAFSIGFSLLILGYVIRALWFLDGTETKTEKI